MYNHIDNHRYEVRKMDSNNYVEIFKALADETRIKVVQILTKENRCACQLLEDFKISQSTLSHHMGLLTRSGLVIAEKEGKWVHYQLNQKLFQELISFFAKNEIIDTPCVSCGN